MEYIGVIVSDPPAVSLPTEVIAAAQPGSDEWFSLSRDQLSIILPRCNNVPLRTEHGRAVVGTVNDGFFNSSGDACIRFGFNGDPAGCQAKSLVDSGLMRGLSLCHSRADLTVREVSICFKGARDNTGITGIVGASTSTGSQERTNHSPYKVGHDSEYVRSYVQASIVRSGMQMPPAPLAAVGLPPAPAPQQTQQAQQFEQLQQFQQFQKMQELQKLQAQQAAQHQKQYAVPPLHIQNVGQPHPDQMSSSSHTRIPMDQAIADAERQHNANLQGHPPVQAPVQTPVPAPTAVPAVAQPGAVPPPAKRARGLPDAVATPTPTPTPDVKVVDSGAPDVDDSDDNSPELVNKIVGMTGPLSNTLKLGLLATAQRNVGMKRKMAEMAAELKESRAKLQDSAEMAKAQSAQFSDVMIPFMKKWTNFTDADATALRTQTGSGQPNPFISKFGPQLVAASMNAMHTLKGSNDIKQSSEQEVQALLDRRLQSYREACALESSSRSGAQAQHAYAPPAPVPPQSGQNFTYASATDFPVAQPASGMVSASTPAPLAAQPSFVIGQLPQGLQTMYEQNAGTEIDVKRMFGGKH